MTRYMITQTLLSSWGYTFSCFEGGEEEAKASFLQTLNREKTEPTEAMLNGIAFENEVYKVVNGENRTTHPKWESGVQAVATALKGASIQVRAETDIEVDGIPVLLYGVLDGLKAGVIYDVKFVSKSFNDLQLAGKYLESPQHSAYLRLIPEATRFEYLVSDGKDLYREVYTRDITPPIENTISLFFRSITGMGLMDLYKEKWIAK